MILELGDEAIVDLDARVAVFFGRVRVTVSTGTPHSMASCGQDKSILHQEVGIDQFHIGG